MTASLLLHQICPVCDESLGEDGIRMVKNSSFPISQKVFMCFNCKMAQFLRRSIWFLSNPIYYADMMYGFYIVDLEASEKKRRLTCSLGIAWQERCFLGTQQTRTNSWQCVSSKLEWYSLRWRRYNQQCLKSIYIISIKFVVYI